MGLWPNTLATRALSWGRAEQRAARQFSQIGFCVAGTTRRPHRVRTHCARLTDRLNCQGHTLTAAALAAEVVRREREAAQLSPELRAAIAKLAPTSRGPLRSMIVPEIELAAARRLPTMSWLTEQLLHSSGRGRRTDKRFALAVLEHMATLSPRPEAQAAIRTLQRSPLAMWAFDHPPAPKRSSAYEQIQKICSRHETNLAVHANVELIRQLAELADASGRPLHPGIGTVGVVDATMMEAHIPAVQARWAG